MVKGVITLLLALCIVLPLVSSQGLPQVTAVNVVAIEVDPLIFAHIKQSQDFTFHIHAYNISDGKPLTNSTTNCSYHLYNSSGNHLYRGINISYSDFDWESKILGANFSHPGHYALEAWCVNSKGGGSIREYFDVTPDGHGYELVDTILPLTLIFVSMILLALSFLFSGKYWLIKSLFIFLSLALGLLALNAARIISHATDRLTSMANAGILIAVILLIFYVSYLLVFATIEIINILKKKGDIKWNADDFKE